MTATRRLVSVLLAFLAVLAGIFPPLAAQTYTPAPTSGGDEGQVTERAVRRQRLARQRQAAAEHYAGRRAAALAAMATAAKAKAGAPGADRSVAKGFSAAAGVAALAAPAAPGIANPVGMPDYMGGVVPNWTNSPVIKKFMDTLPGLGRANANNLGNFIPVAAADTQAFPGSDLYRIGLDDYRQQMHSSLPATRLRGYKDLNPGAEDTTAPGGNASRYLGPVIIAKKDRPVRIQFINQLPTGTAGNLLLPVDTSTMGCGTGPLGGTELYTQNRAELHLHGGATPWISDGTPHQWFTPAGDPTSYKRGVAFQNVPDMGAFTGDGMGTYFYPNQQSARLMFYHDHTSGLTRLNVYAGEAAGYLLYDDTELGLIQKGVLPDNGGGLYTFGIPLIIQDKTFVPDEAKLLATDPTWNYPGWGGPAPAWGGTGDLWYPHVYMPNQNPYDITGANPMGRWDYGPWFWPPVTTLAHGPIPGATVNDPDLPGTPNPSLVPEAFMDTAMVNGAAYPRLTVEPRAYRFRILNAANDRFFNLQLYRTDQPGGTEVSMVVAPDGRAGGIPNPANKGPQMVQIGTEGGFLPAPVVHDNTPIGYNFNRRDIVVLNVQEKNLFMGPAERADVVVDFSAFAGQSIILYNDAPAPVPAFDPRYDYYTGNPDQTSTGGAPSTLPGYGPNTRTIMRFDVAPARADGVPAAPYDQAGLISAFLPNAVSQGVFARSQDLPIVPQKAYNPAFAPDRAFTDTWARIQSTSMNFTATETGTATSMALKPKAIQELFELDYGRMNATLGVEVPFTSFVNQTTIPLGYIDPVTEDLQDGTTQIWKITHNGVDTHPIHFHLFDVQIVNRVGWDGAVRLPDANELGWKETVRMNPLEDIIVALRPLSQRLPWAIPTSTRPIDPTKPAGTITVASPANGNPLLVNNSGYFAWEYVWHCHILGHEENDMMRPLVLNVATTAPAAPSALTAVLGIPVALGDIWTSKISLSWADNANNESGMQLERQVDGGAFAPLATLVPNQVSYIDYDTQPGKTYGYQLRAWNQGGYSAWATLLGLTTPVPTPDLPTPLSPVSNISTATPNYTFTLVAGANSYAVQLVNTLTGATTTTAAFTTAQVDPGKTGLTGSIAQTPALAPGNYTWSVQAYNTFGRNSGWSLPMSFTVGTIPAAPVPTAPTGTGNPTTPSYTFPAVAWGVSYTIELTDTINNTTATLPWNPVDPPILGTVAAVAQNPALAVGQYSFRVQASNALGASPWSAPLAFTVGDVPLAPVGTAPLGVINTGSPVYTFNTVAWAAEYALELVNTSVTPNTVTTTAWIPAATVGTGAIGTIPQAPVLDPGNYTWTVKARNVLGTSPASAPVAFTVGTIPAAPVPTAPTGVGNGTTPTYTFPAVLWGMEYNLELTTTTPGVTAPVTTTGWLPAGTVVTAGVGGILQAPALAIGTYSFRIQSRNALGTGPWSAPAAFTVGDVPVAPVGTSPLGPITSTTPTYSFGTVAWGVEYSLQLTNLSVTPNKVTTTAWLPAASVGTGTVGSILQGLALDPANYRWSVQARNVLGTGPWSAPLDFTVGTVPAAPVPTAPSGVGNGTTPTYTFPAVLWGMEYSLELTNTTNGIGTVTTTPWLPAATVVSGGIGRILQSPALTVGTYSFRVQSRNALGTGAWSLAQPFTVGDIPTPPAGTAPSGVINTTTPTYTFGTVLWAAEYNLMLTNTITGAVSTTGWLPAATVGTGAIPQTTALVPGTYEFRVQARNVLGTGDFGAPVAFQVGTIPAAPAGISPVGTVNTATPTYTFGTVAWAMEYSLQLTNLSASPATTTTTPRFPAAPGATGSAVQATALAAGNYQFSVQAHNALGSGAFGVPVNFTVGTIPAAPVGRTPAGAIATPNPVYTFSTVAWAVDYQVRLVDTITGTTLDLGWVSAASVGAGSFLQPAPLAAGRYTWAVQARNALGTGAFSTAIAFTVGAVPVAPLASAPTGAITTATPVYTFSTVTWAAEYGIQLTNLNTGVTTTTWVPAASVGAGTFVQPTALPAGSYRWRVQARNALGTGPFSNRLSFIVGVVPAAPVAASPSGPGVSATPTYTFSLVEWATDYRVQVSGPNGTTTTPWTPVASVGTGTLTQATPLPAGNYTWRVEARNALGTSPWSASLSFTTGSLPATPAALAPSGPGASPTPAYSFTAVAGATDFQVTWTDTVTRTTTRGAWVPAALADPGATGTGTWLSTATLVSGRTYTWTVRARNGLGTTPASAAMSFTVQ